MVAIPAGMGCDERTIADMRGPQTIERARHYSRRAEKRERLTAVIRNFDNELAKRRTKIV